jgi:uncharacterized protein YdhG (YjbR/CyaY superfamily)
MNAGKDGSSEVDAYIAQFPPETRRALEEVRRCIRRAAPRATELMNYRIPAFALVKDGKRDQQVMMAGFSKHVGFYPTAAVIDAFRDRLADYKFAKGSIRFPLDRPVPAALVIEMVKYRLSRLRGEENTK